MILHARQITKVFPGTVALDRVDFQVRRGEVSVLIGENGAGKSTLVKILAGVLQPTSGRLELDGFEIYLHSTRDADAHGIGIIYQELNLFPNLSVTENIFMARDITRGGITVNRRAEERTVRELLSWLEQPIDPRALVGELPLGQQQIVEIAKALARDVRVLMMDEPTSALSTAEIGVLFRVIRELKARGVAIVYISHKLEELLEIGDYVTVLRDGRLVAEAAAAEVDVGWIIERMTGRQGAAAAAPHPPVSGAEVLRVELGNVSFGLHAGEVVGIYGLMGAGRTELFETLAGLRREAHGAIRLNGERLEALPVHERIARGLVLVPEDRQRAGLVPTLSVRDNMTLASLARYTRAGVLSPEKETSTAAGMMADLHIKAAGPGQPITSLSGGNQQKAVIGKYLLTSPKVLLMDEPARGVDVGARAEIFEIIRKLAAQGLGIIFTSSELQEVMTLADRVLVMAKGRITAEFEAGRATEAALVAASSPRPGGTHACN